MRKWMVLFFFVLFVIGTDTFLISPLIPKLQELFQIRTEISGWMMGAYALGYAVFALIAGPLSDGWNRKKVMLYGMLCFSLSTILCGMAVGFWTMFIFRFAAGVSAAFTSPQVWAAITTLVPPNKIIKAMGIATAGLAASQALGVPIGSSLAVAHWYYPFFVIGACALLLVLWIHLVLPDLSPVPASGFKKSSILTRYAPLLADGHAKGAFFAYFLFQLGNFAAFTFIGRWMTDRFGLSLDQVGTVMIFLGLGNLIGSFGSAIIVKKFNSYTTMAAGMISLIILFLILPHLPFVPAVEGFYFIIFAIAGTIFPLMMGVLAALNPTLRGTISSLANSTMYAATTLGAWIAGVLYAMFGGFAAVGLFTSLCFVLSLLTFRSSGVLRVKPEEKEQVAS